MKYHNDFSGKDCPRTLRNAGLIPLFEELADIEYIVENDFSDAEITFVSNDKSAPNKVMTVSGTGVDAAASVPGVISDLFEMTVTPNPIVDASEVKFNVTGSANVNIELIDATGRIVNSVYNGVTTGETVGLNSSQLSSGTYYINANVDGKTTQIPVVITK